MVLQAALGALKGKLGVDMKYVVFLLRMLFVFVHVPIVTFVCVYVPIVTPLRRVGSFLISDSWGAFMTQSSQTITTPKHWALREAMMMHVMIMLQSA